MIKEETFVSSHRPYAVDLSSYSYYDSDREYRDGRATQTIRAVWFRRKEGRFVAYSGSLWNISDARDALDMLAKHTDGRYGGNWLMGWDGGSAWTEGMVTTSVYEAHLDLLKVALSRFVVSGLPPEGFDGWWTFRD